mgnify:FL=1|tara:strand:- start:105 stop:719 length:615 start_codon:yes stop_codon:yes gene_type:complete
MKVKIKKGNKTKEYKVIESWSDVTLEKWLKLIDFNSLSKADEAQQVISALSTIPKKLVNELSLKDVALMMEKLAELQAKKNSSLKKIIKLEGVEYGFHPDLSEITLGEYADLETLIKLGLEKHLPEIMAILFRPVVDKKNNVYTIEAYDGKTKIRSEIMKKMSAVQVETALVFFWILGSELSLILPSFLMQITKETKPQLQVKV